MSELAEMTASNASYPTLSQAYSQIVSSIVAGDETANSFFFSLFGPGQQDEYIWVKSMSDFENEYREILFYLYKAVQKNGIEDTMKEFTEFLNSDGGSMSELEFTKSLLK